MTFVSCPDCGTVPCARCAPKQPYTPPIAWTTGPVKAPCRQCNGTKRVFVASPWTYAPPVKVVCGECAEDKP